MWYCLYCHSEVYLTLTRGIQVFRGYLLYFYRRVQVSLPVNAQNTTVLMLHAILVVWKIAGCVAQC